jgi:serine/threonine-protein kinase
MAPEQVTPLWGSVSPRTDVFGLGAILYTLLTGRPPFDGRRLADVLGAAASGKPVTAPVEIRPEVSSGLNAACLRSLEKRPERRLGSVQEFRAALVEAGTGMP